MKENAKPTPGPWTVSAEANARLLAAAPDLLAALKRAEVRLACHNDQDIEGAARIHAAIAKAEGR